MVQPRPLPGNRMAGVLDSRQGYLVGFFLLDFCESINMPDFLSIEKMVVRKKSAG
jgi:hypothetical protein